MACERVKPTHGFSISKTENQPELMEHSLTGGSSKDFKGGCSQGELLFSECPEGATKQNSEASEIPISLERHLSPDSPRSENLEVLAETVGTLDLKSIKKNRSGAAKKWSRRARHTEAPARNSASNQPQQGPSKGGPCLKAARCRP